MGQTRMFRDRVVSMEQTLEGGEKHLPLLKEICREALPDFAFREHSLDHERDLFVMDFDRPDGAKKRLCWTRMVLFDAERIPSLTADPSSAVRGRIVELLRSHASRPEIVITFRHLEDGWVDTPEPRREGRRRRRGGRGGGRGPAQRSPAERPPGSPQPPQRRPGRSPGGPGGSPTPGGPTAPRPAALPAQGQGATGDPGQSPPGGKRRRRIRRRRRGRGPGGAGPGSGTPTPPAGSRP